MQTAGLLGLLGRQRSGGVLGPPGTPNGCFWGPAVPAGGHPRPGDAAEAACRAQNNRVRRAQRQQNSCKNNVIPSLPEDLTVNAP